MGDTSKNPDMTVRVVEMPEVTLAGGAITLDSSDLEIGAVEIKDGTTDQRATVDGSGALLVASAPAASELHLGSVGGQLIVVSTEFTRPSNTDPYTAKDVVGPTGAAANLTFANLARVAQGSGYITKARIMSDMVAIVPRLRLHLFHTAPTPIADNAPYTLQYADRAKRVGYIDFDPLGIEGAGGDAVGTLNAISQLPFQCAAASDDLIGILECIDAFTPTSAGKVFIELTAEVN